jgi:hypothetical protein
MDSRSAVPCILVVDGAATGAWKKAAQTDFILTPNCSQIGDDARPRSPHS